MPMDTGFLLHTALAEAAGGATAGLVADSVLYAVDSAKVRSQSRSKPTGSGSGSMRVLFRGLVSSLLLGSVPVFGCFFVLYAPAREALCRSEHEVFVPLAATCAAVPATVLGVPSDVIKKRLVLGIDADLSSAVRRATSEHGWRGLFAGWHVNLVRDLPFAAAKMALYEVFAASYRSWSGAPESEPISPLGAGMCGAASGVGCAILTCPLDVVNTRIKAGQTNTNTSTASTSILRVGSEVVAKDGVAGLFRGVAMKCVVLGVGSCIFWPIHRSVSRYCHDLLQANHHSDHDGFAP